MSFKIGHHRRTVQSFLNYNRTVNGETTDILPASSQLQRHSSDSLLTLSGKLFT